MSDTRIKVGLSEAVIAEVDALRGDVPRERFLRRIIEERLQGSGGLVIPRVPEPSPSKAPPRTDDVSRRPPPLVVTSKTDHAWVGIRATCMRSGCPVPKDKAAHL